MVDKRLLVQRLQQVIELFDDVILEEYSYDHKHMPRVHTGATGAPSDRGPASSLNHGPLGTCDFCATDILQSFFGALKRNKYFLCD